MSKKILFVNPHQENVLWSVLKMPPLGLATLAAFMPPQYEIKIIDESISKINFEEYFDLVLITCMTHTAPRAYSIATEFKIRNIPVIMGGVHVTMVPEEAILFCDSVVIGEAESVIQSLITDFENNRLNKFYFGKRLPLNNLPLPRIDLLENKYKIASIQTTRGCPFNCEFCSVTEFSGHSYRERPVEDVINEIRILGYKRLIFADDNILGIGRKAEDNAIHLFRKLKELNIIWGAQTSINISENEKILKEAVDSGASGFFIGIESLSENSLKLMGKRINLRLGIQNYKSAIKRLHDYGIVVTGAFVIGNDGDNKDIFKKTIDFISESDVDRAQITISTPLPGTRLYNRLLDEKRILYTNYPIDWRKYDLFHVVYKPKYMGIEELESGFLDIYNTLTSKFSSLKRAIRSLMNTNNWLSSITSYKYNRTYGKSANYIYRKENLLDSST
jgi:radical SAM superfamily enzyme YgiQ (UPF0313 family)